MNTYEHTRCFSAACNDAGVCNVDTAVDVVCKKKETLLQQAGIIHSLLSQNT